MTFKKRFLGVLNRTLNPITAPVARSGRGPFSLIRHVGRKSGATFETPVILAETRDGFVAELTYGADVNWYRNIVAAGGCVVVHRRREYRVVGIERLDPEAGLRAFGGARAVVLRILRRQEFRLLRTELPLDR